jgi:uncharacterized protein YkwD
MSRSAYRNRKPTTWLLLVLVVLVIGTGCIPYPNDLAPNRPTTGGGGGSTGGGGGGVISGGGGIPIGSTSGCLGPGAPSDATHQAAFDQLNLYRLGNGLQVLQYSITLQLAADLDAKDMYDRNFFSHTNPDGEDPGDRAVAAGFCHPYGGENIAKGRNTLSSAGEVMTVWKNSPGHNANMLRTQFKYVGIGYYHVQVGQDHFYYWVQLFASEG